MGIYHFATGHYVRRRFINGCYHITTGADPDKDQSFFLWGLPQEILQRMLLPMGNLTKARVREIAAERGFLKAAHKRDSLGVCFCPMDYRTFLHKELPEGSILPGKFFDEMGNFIARHKGYPFYTIGQRRGLGIDLNRAVFVKEIIPAENKVILSDLKALEKIRNETERMAHHQSRFITRQGRHHRQNTLSETSQPLHSNPATG